MNEQVNLIEKSSNQALANQDPVYLITDSKPQNLVVKKQENDARQVIAEEKDTITVSTTLPPSKLANNLTENLHLKSDILKTVQPPKVAHSITEMTESEEKEFRELSDLVDENNLSLEETNENCNAPIEKVEEDNVDAQEDIEDDGHSENDASKNGRNLLHTFLQKQKVHIPTYQIIQPEPNVIVSASCTIGHHVYKEQGRGKTRREAKNNVAMLLYKKIQESSKVEMSQQNKGISLLKSLSKLHGLLQEKKLPLPTYTLIKASPVACYEATCTWDNQIYTAQGESSSQKDAKRQAAFLLLQKILQNLDNK
jgi:dsRNA-specific ribonuclease